MGEKKVTADRLIRALEQEPDLLEEVTLLLLEKKAGIHKMKRQLEEIVPGTQTPDGRYLVICQDWTEHERGWGSRPDGYTLHLTLKDRTTFVKGYDEQYNNKDVAPDEYTEGRSVHPRIVAVDKTIYDIIANYPTKVHQYPWQAFGIQYDTPKVGPEE